MHHHLPLLPVIIWSLFLIPTTSTSCPEDCICHYTTVDCGNHGWNTIPLAIPQDTTHLYLDGNNLGTLTVNSLPLLPELVELYLNSSNIDGNIPQYMFTVYTNLKVIDLSDNDLYYLHSDICSGLDLTALILSNNRGLVDYASTAFRNCAIEELYLDSCAFTSLQLNVELYSSLRMLSMSYNSDRLLTHPGLLEQADLESLVMEYSNLTSPVFIQGASIRNLNLNGNNRINTHGYSIWEVLESVSDLRALSLSDTGLEDVVIPENCNALTYVVLSNNYLSEITTSSFAFTPQLDTLDLSFNTINIISSEFGTQLPRLAVLDLSTNYLSALEYDTFSPLGSLRYLDISDNFIESFDPSMHDVFSHLEDFRLFNVPLNCSCDMLWFRQWVHVVTPAKSIEGASCTIPVVQDILNSDIRTFQCQVPSIREFTIDMDQESSDVLIRCTGVGDPTPHVILTNLTNESSRTQQVNEDGSVTTSVVVQGCLPIGAQWCHAANVLGASDSSHVITSAEPFACPPPVPRTTEGVTVPVHTTNRVYTTDAPTSQIESTVITTQEPIITTDYTTTNHPPHVGDTSTRGELGGHQTASITTPTASTTTNDLVINPPVTVTEPLYGTTENHVTQNSETTQEERVAPQKSGSKLTNGSVAGIIVAVMLVCIILIIGAVLLISYCYKNKHIYSVNEQNEMPVSTISNGQNGSTNGHNGVTIERQNGTIQNGHEFHDPMRHQTYIHYTLEDVQC